MRLEEAEIEAIANSLTNALGDCYRNQLNNTAEAIAQAIRKLITEASQRQHKV